MSDLFKKEIDELIDLCQANQNPLVIGMPEFGKGKSFLPNLQNRLEQELKDSAILVLIPTVFQNVPCVIVHDISDNAIKNIPLNKFSDLVSGHFISGKKVFIIINSCEDFEKDLELMTLCKQLRHNPNFNWMYVGYTPIYSQLRYDQDPFEFLSAYTLRVLPMNFKDRGSYLEYLLGLYKLELSSSKIKEIIDLSGGNPGLIKGMVQNIKQGIEIDSINDKRMNTRITHILNGLNAEQYKCLLNIVLEKSPERDENSQFLIDFGYIDEKGKIFSALIAKYIKSISNDSQNLIPDDFTVIEEKIYKLLLLRKGEIVSRDEIANEIWGRDRLNKYSDYVIDKHISNIRKILIEKPENPAIKTFKKRGFMYEC